MGSRQRYERIAAVDHDDSSMTSPSAAVPASPPPSFRSRTSSRRPSRDQTDGQTLEQRNLNDAFDAPSDDDSDAEDTPDSRRLIHSAQTNTDDGTTQTTTSSSSPPPAPTRTVTEIPIFTPTGPGGRSNAAANDGVWANLNAKPRAGEDLEEKPPTYEQAAADATPPYWETTVLSPYGTSSNPDDVFVDGLLVGSLFSFIWNALISMSFQLIGFLLTYLLHTTHAAKHGSRAGLGITLVQYGFQMRYAVGGGQSPMDGVVPGSGGAPVDGVPSDPNKHDFDSGKVGTGGPEAGNGGMFNAMSTTDWLSYVLMIVGWFILIRAVSDFLRARRQEALVRSSPSRGLGVAVVAEGEAVESSV
ncbi:hypothetical protein BDY17DRAFT_301521 [Neohortaea acidophila]|uniref:Metal homeostatis protein bsd2 n=1 Tax=Neohortaea acidophila TaxID=245834 RepID=A0A6A6PNH1_9PEZI|nr:uncharacterized protein BDY17DRAFT_301521 [Neohortaea acidophila]KAF2481552.1 hypothetical protein BDY17DRAFT_301521 [Neohortaea acidophila]